MADVEYAEVHERECRNAIFRTGGLLSAVNECSSNGCDERLPKSSLIQFESFDLAGVVEMGLYTLSHPRKFNGEYF